MRLINSRKTTRKEGNEHQSQNNALQIHNVHTKLTALLQIPHIIPDAQSPNQLKNCTPTQNTLLGMVNERLSQEEGNKSTRQDTSNLLGRKRQGFNSGL